MLTSSQALCLPSVGESTNQHTHNNLDVLRVWKANQTVRHREWDDMTQHTALLNVTLHAVYMNCGANVCGEASVRERSLSVVAILTDFWNNKHEMAGNRNAKIIKSWHDDDKSLSSKYRSCQKMFGQLYGQQHGQFFQFGYWPRILPQKLTVAQQVNKFPPFYGTRKSITAFKTSCPLSLSWATSI